MQHLTYTAALRAGAATSACRIATGPGCVLFPNVALCANARLCATAVVVVSAANPGAPSGWLIRS
jgi:hypothetical protein